jgi:hypothetical protein
MESWQARGRVLIACNCDFGCPCNVNGRPTTGKCEGGWTWAIDEGRIGDVSVDGLVLAVFANWPAAIHEGGGVAVGLIDERADDGQAEALTSLIRGEGGGPWGIFINTYELDGPRRAGFDIRHDGYTVDGIAELGIETIKNPVTGAEVHPSLTMPEGLVAKHLDLLASTTFRVEDGVAYDHSGRYAAVGPFDYIG